MIKWNWGKILLNNFSNQPQKGYIEVEPDAGIPFRRLMYSDIGDLATCNFILSRSDYINFMSWYKHELRQGTIPFTIYDCRVGKDRVARIVGDVPQYTTNQQYYDLSLTLYFQPYIEEVEYSLIVNNNDNLIINNHDKLIVDIKLHI